jgi:very-short-patch-repair endonuclease
LSVKNITQELRPVSPGNIYCNELIGRNRVTAINANGVFEHLSNTQRVSLRQKISILNEWEKCGFVSGKTISNTRKEHSFFDDISDIMSAFGLTVVRQKVLGGFIYDFFIQEINLIVEFDENSHYGYNPTLEKAREEFAIKSGFSTVRVSDSDSNCQSISTILKDYVLKDIPTAVRIGVQKAR